MSFWTSGNSGCEVEASEYRPGGGGGGLAGKGTRQPFPCASSHFFPFPSLPMPIPSPVGVCGGVASFQSPYMRRNGVEYWGYSGIG